MSLLLPHKQEQENNQVIHDEKQADPKEAKIKNRKLILKIKHMPENLTPNPWDNYIPSSSEKKQAVLMYMFVGLLLSLQQQDVSPYMHHHIKQSMGRIILLVLVIALDVILLVLSMFGKFFAILGGIITIPVLVLGIVCVKQAYDGKYQRDSNGAMRFFSFFSGLGSWVLNLFDADHYQSKIDLPTT